MPALASPENLIKTFLDSSGLDMTRFAAITGCVSQSALSLALSGVKDLTIEQSRACLNTVERLNKLLTAAEPLPLNLRDVRTIKKLLVAQDEGTLKIEVSILSDDWAKADRNVD
jgi:hypothetical protein